MAEGRHTTNPKDYRKGGRDRRGCHVEIERSFEIRRHRDRDRIGAKRRLSAAEGGDMLWRAAGIGSRKPDLG